MSPITLRPNEVARHGKSCYLVLSWINNNNNNKARRVVASSWGAKRALSAGSTSSSNSNAGQPEFAAPPAALVLYNTLSQRKDPVPLFSNNSTNSKTKGIACYCCGPTVYDDAHLGHARTYVWFDLFRRILEQQHAAATWSSSWSSNNNNNNGSIPPPPPPPPLFVMNITDVDDKILQAAASHHLAAGAQSFSSPMDYARHYEQKFWTDLDALNCLRPHVVVRVSEHVEQSIIPYIQTLMEKGMAYQQSPPQQPQPPNEDDGNDEQGGVLFDVGAFEQAEHKYGKLVPNLRATSAADLPTQSQQQDDTTQQQSEHALPAGPGLPNKKDVRDFALWKQRKGGEALFWESPWGAGRPGWHIECSAMIESVRQQFPSHEFMLHAGGIDLKFPHHTNEIAQAEAYHHHHYNHCCSPPCQDMGHSNNGSDDRRAVEWIPHWMHMGHLHIGGLKMSKSLKNFISIESKRKDNTEWADNFRLWCLALSGSYRDATTYSEERMDESRNVRAKLVRFLVGAQGWVNRRKQDDFTTSNHNQTLQWQTADVRLFEAVNTTRTQLQSALLDDLNGAACLDALLALIELGNDNMLGNGGDDARRHEPIEAAVLLLRTTLQLLGFHKQTYEAGLFDSNSGESAGQGRKVVLDEFTKFRSTVRRAAIADHQDRVATSNMKCLLEACDRLRDKIFPSMGVELIDRSLRTGASPSGEDSTDEWQYCVQHTNSETPAPSKSPSLAPNVTGASLAIEPHLLFRSGSYEGQFSDYDDAGIPTKLADGSPISKSQAKKLRKLLEKYERRHAETRNKS